MRAGAGICLLAVLMVATACTDDAKPDGSPNGDATASTAPSEPAEASAECVATGEAVRTAITEVVEAHAGESVEEFVAVAGQAPTIAAELELSPDDINCEQGTAFALAFNEAEKIPHGTPGEFLTKFLLIGEIGQRMTFGSDWSPATPVEAPVPVGDAITFDEGEAALADAKSCKKVADGLALSMKAALDTTARLSLPQFFGAEEGGEDINPYVVEAVKTASDMAESTECSPADLWERAIGAMSELRFQGFAPHVAFGAFMQIEIYPRVYEALGS